MDLKVILNICLVVLLIVDLFILVLYNKLIKLQNKVKKAKANIEIYLNKRFDLVPNLVECIKSYTKHEESTLEGIVNLRNRYNNQTHMNVNEASKMNSDLTKFLVTFENYPDLKADSQYMSLQNKLSTLEDELERARHRYNDDVMRYNVAIESVPSNIVASMFAFKKAELFKVEERKEDNVSISFE